jgi:predicted nucleic acid-binding protein
MKSLYLDLCTLKRPFDAPTSDRVQLEALAVASLLGAFQRGEVRIVSSAILGLENSRNPDPSRRDAVEDMLSRFQPTGLADVALLAPARKIEMLGFQALDALHLASAAEARCDRFVTCDDAILRLARRFPRDALGVIVADPLEAVNALREEGL